MIKSHISKVEKDRYMDIYPVFLDFFKDRELDRGPTIPKIDIQNIDKVVDIVKKDEITASDLEVLSKCFNNSIVGTSKLFYA